MGDTWYSLDSKYTWRYRLAHLFFTRPPPPPLRQALSNWPDPYVVSSAFEAEQRFTQGPATRDASSVTVNLPPPPRAAARCSTCPTLTC